ncbi:MAG: DUF1385 domain-containing protein [Lachnospiraceae bacterium]|nr:DUF1385 domain-containing protein [Lachnospiraceae bacterium]MDD6450141.1 DUF1385 domain-containing protein [Lachnospiraceae bacterium]MDD6451418.1 DUF1385 domain-containing protein [Lachnospiraceae bacterium]
MEGVMMRSGSKYAVAVRLPDKSIHIDEKTDNFDQNPWLKVPIIRGMVSFFYSLVTGIQSLMTSANYFEDDEETKAKKAKMTEEEKKKMESRELWGSFAFSLIVAVLVFFLLPYGLSKLMGRLIPNRFAVTALEGLIRVLIFLVYILLISRMEDIKRVFMYHGAEHKCINCVENGLPLTVLNVKKSTRLHKRCGTSFIFIVMIISIFVFMFIRSSNPLMQIFLRLLLIPVVAGISYEFIRWAGRSENPLVNLLSKPGLALQKLTTREPDDGMIEVGIASVEAVFDWKAFQEKNKDKF